MEHFHNRAGAVEDSIKVDVAVPNNPEFYQVVSIAVGDVSFLNRRGEVVADCLEVEACFQLWKNDGVEGVVFALSFHLSFLCVYEKEFSFLHR